MPGDDDASHTVLRESRARSKCRRCHGGALRFPPFDLVDPTHRGSRARGYPVPGVGFLFMLLVNIVDFVTFYTLFLFSYPESSEFLGHLQLRVTVF